MVSRRSAEIIPLGPMLLSIVSGRISAAQKGPMHCLQKALGALGSNVSLSPESQPPQRIVNV